MKKSSWDERIRRAERLTTAYPFAAEVLRFYLPVARFQKDLYAHVRGACGQGLERREASSLREELDLFVLLPRFPAFLSLAKDIGPGPLAQLAGDLMAEGSESWLNLLTQYWDSGPSDALAGNPRMFFARAFLQPYAEYLADHTETLAGDAAPRLCPACGGKPQVGVLRQEGDGAKRSLVCSLCSTEWNYRRIVCPACEEESVDKLPVYTASEFKHIRIEACETCKTYITTVDLTKDGFAVPEVDDLATIPLSLWARENGYVKLQPNLLGT